MNPQAPSGFGGRSTIAAATAAAIVCALLVGLHPVAPVTALAGAALCLVLPGFLILLAVSPRQPLDDYPLLALLAVAVSLITTAAIGALLAAVAARLRSQEAAGALAFIAVLSGGVAASRTGPRPPSASKKRSVFGRQRTLQKLRLRLTTFLLVAAAGVFIVAATRALEEQQSQAPYTEFGAVPQSGKLRLTVVNHQGRRQTYVYVIKLHGRSVIRGQGTVNPDRTLAVTVAVPPQRWLSVSLFKDNLRAPYRVLALRSK